MYIYHATMERINFETALINAGFLIKQNLIWVKNSMAMGRQDYQWQHEPILYGWKPGAAHYFTNDRSKSTIVQDDEQLPNIKKMTKQQLQQYAQELQDTLSTTATTVVRENKPAVSKEHPTMKPVRLNAKFIANSTRPGETALDQFAGSGSTMLAAEQLGITSLNIEIDPQYCQVIINRYQEYTGNTAVKVGT